MGTEKNETKRVKTSDLKKQAKKKSKNKNGKIKFKDRHPKLSKAINYWSRNISRSFCWYFWR